MKPCVLCDHFRNGDRCAAPRAVTTNPIDGKDRLGFCLALRANVTECGPQAAWFCPLPEPAMAA